MEMGLLERRQMLRQIYLKQVSEKEEKEEKVEEEEEDGVFRYDKTRSKRIPGRSQVIGSQRVRKRSGDNRSPQEA